MVAKSLHRSVDLVNSVGKRVTTYRLIRGTDRVLLAISGGQDSICLLVILNQLQAQMEINLGLLWCQHLWQIDSFSLMRQMTKISYLFQLNSYFAVTPKPIPSELLARNWRQNCSYRISLFYNYYKVSFAHSANDKAETILLNIMRGTGVTGLSPLDWEKQISENSVKKEEHVSQFFISSLSFFFWSPFFLSKEKKKIKSIREKKTPIGLCTLLHTDLYVKNLNKHFIKVHKSSSLLEIMEHLQPIHSPVPTFGKTPWILEKVKVEKRKKRSVLNKRFNRKKVLRKINSKKWFYSASYAFLKASFTSLEQIQNNLNFDLSNICVRYLEYPSTSHTQRSFTNFFSVKLKSKSRHLFICKIEKSWYRCEKKPPAAFYVIKDYKKAGRVVVGPLARKASAVNLKAYFGIEDSTAVHFSAKGVYCITREAKKKETFLFACARNESFSKIFMVCAVCNQKSVKSFQCEIKDFTQQNVKFKGKEANLYFSLKLPLYTKGYALQVQRAKIYQKLRICKKKESFQKITTVLNQGFNEKLVSFANPLSMVRLLCCWSIVPTAKKDGKKLRNILTNLTYSPMNLMLNQRFNKESDASEKHRIKEPFYILFYFTGDLKSIINKFNKIVSNPKFRKKVESSIFREFLLEIPAIPVYRHERQNEKALQGWGHFKNSWNILFQKSNDSDFVLEKKSLSIIRPLLSLNRFEISKLCIFWHLPVYPDKSNQKVGFLRNRVRKQLLPTIKLFFNSRIENVLFQFSEIFSAEDSYMNQLTNELVKKLIMSKTSGESAQFFYNETNFDPRHEKIKKTLQPVTHGDPVCEIFTLSLHFLKSSSFQIFVKPKKLCKKVSTSFLSSEQLEKSVTKSKISFPFWNVFLNSRSLPGQKQLRVTRNRRSRKYQAQAFKNTFISPFYVNYSLISYIEHNRLIYLLSWAKLKVINIKFFHFSVTHLFKKVDRNVEIFYPIQTIPRYSMPLGAAFWIWNRKFCLAKELNENLRGKEGNALLITFNKEFNYNINPQSTSAEFWQKRGTITFYQNFVKSKLSHNKKMGNIFTRKFFIKFDTLEMKKKEIYWPLIFSFLPLALQRRFVKLFLLNQNWKKIRYSQIEHFIAVVKKLSL